MGWQFLFWLSLSLSYSCIRSELTHATKQAPKPKAAAKPAAKAAAAVEEDSSEEDSDDEDDEEDDKPAAKVYSHPPTSPFLSIRSFRFISMAHLAHC